MKWRDRFAYVSFLSAIVYICFFAGILQAQNNENCIACNPAIQYPYLFNFGSTSYPTTEHHVWRDTSAFGAAAFIKPWSFEAAPGENTRNLCFDGSKYQDELDEDFPAMYSRCMAMKKNKSYLVKFTVQTARGGLGFKLGLVHKEKNGQYHYHDKGCGKLLYSTTLSGGTSSFTIPIDQVPFDSIFALAFQMSGSKIDTRVYFKQIEIIQNSEVDIAISKPYFLQSSCNLGSAEKISFLIKNLGKQTHTQVLAHYQFEGQAVKSETFPIHLLPGKDTLLVFSERIDLSSKKYYYLSIFLDRNIQDGKPENDTLKRISLHNYQELIQAPMENILNQQNQMHWSMGSGSYNENGSWTITRAEATTYAHLKTNTENNQQWLHSPCVEMEKDKVYKINFLYKSERNDLPEKMSLFVSEKIGVTELPIWSREGFVNTSFQEGVAYFTPQKTASYHLAFFAYSDNFSEGIRIQEISIDTTTRQFPPMAEDFFLDERNASIGIADVNNDGNTWKIEKSDAYNSSYAIHLRMGSSYAKNLHDIFRTKPVFLSEGTEYRVYYAKKSSVSDKLPLNIYVSSLPNYKYLSQAEFLKKDTIRAGNYQMNSFLFTPTVSAYYYLFFEEKGQDIINNNIISIDNVLIKKESQLNDSLVRIEKIMIPSSATDGDRSAVLSLDIKNFSAHNYPLNTIKLCYQVNKNKIVVYSYTGSLKSYEYKSISLDAYPIDFSLDTIFEIKSWVQYSNTKKSDTVYVVVKTAKNAPLPFIEHFADLASLENWKIIQSGSPTNTWSFVHDNIHGAFTPPSYALCKPATTQVLDEYLASPGMFLSKDTTYFLSFYYAAGESLNSIKDKLSIMYSNTSREKENFIYPLLSIQDIANTDYKKVIKYFKVPSSGRYFIAFKAESPAYSSGIRLDEVYIMDSLSTLKTNLQLEAFQFPMGGSCFLTDQEKVSVNIRNKGYFDVPKLYIKYKTGRSEIYCDTLVYTLSPDQSLTYTLRKTWDLSAPGKDSIRVWIDMPMEMNRLDDSTKWVVIEHRDSDTSLPLMNGFETTDAYWTFYDRFGRNAWTIQEGSSAYEGEKCMVHIPPSENKDSDSWLFSPCMKMEKDKTYTLSFYAKTLSSTQAEKLAIYFLDTIDTKIMANLFPYKVFDNINNTTYTRFDVFYTPSKEGPYTVAFRLASKNAGEQVFMDQVSVSPFDSAYDISILSIYSPSSGILGAEESLSLRLDNRSPFEAKNVKIYAKVGERLYSDLIPKIPGRSFLDFSFSDKLDLQIPGEYMIQVFVDYPTDQNRNNDTLVLRLISEACSMSLLSFESPSKPPYSAFEEVKIALKKEGTAEVDFLLSLKMNGKHILSDTLKLWPSSSMHIFSKTLDMSKAGTYVLEAELSSVKDTLKKDNILSKTFVNKGKQVKMLAITKPLSTSKTYSSSEILEVSLQNPGDYPLHDLVLECRINDVFVCADTLSEILAGTEKVHRFKPTLDLSNYGTFHIEVKAILPEDIQAADNVVAIEIEHLSQAKDVALLNIEAPVAPPFTEAETISVRVKNNGVDVLQAVPIFVELNTQKYSAQIEALEAGQNRIYHFPTKMNMQENKKYSLLVYTALSQDEDPTNDTLRRVFYPVSIEENERDGLDLYPNPAGDFIQVTAPTAIDLLEVYQVNGQKVLSLSKLSNSHRVSLSSLPAGLYYIRLLSAGIQKNKSFIKK